MIKHIYFINNIIISFQHVPYPALNTEVRRPDMATKQIQYIWVRGQKIGGPQDTYHTHAEVGMLCILGK